MLVNNVWGGYAAYHEDRYADMEGPFWEQPLRVWDDMFAGRGARTLRDDRPRRSAVAAGRAWW